MRTAVLFIAVVTLTVAQVKVSGNSVLTGRISLSPSGASTPVTVSTAQYDNFRTGSNTAETILTQANVSSIRLRCTYSVDAAVYAQPLIIAGVSISGASRVLITATLNNSIYAFNADTCATFIWKTNVGTPVAQGDTDIYSESLGCMATPVVDVPNAIVYALCQKTTELWRLFSLNLADGSTHHAPVTISGTKNSHTFDPTIHLGRPGLLLSNGNVYIGFSSYGDADAYFGWAMAYNSSLTQVGLWVSVSSSGSQGGIWQSGRGILSDGSGNQYLVTGNGSCGAASGNYGESVVKLNSTLVVTDYMTPTNCSALNGSDLDVGSNGPILIESGSYIVTGGKDGRIWVLNAAALGSEQASGPGIHQVFNLSSSTRTYGGLAFGNSALYVAGAVDDFDGGPTTHKISKYVWNGSVFNTTPTVSSSSSFSYPGAALAYTANGSTAGTGLVWATTPDTSANSNIANGTLRVFNADTMEELYNSGQHAGDTLGEYSKFAMPTVAGGQVYVATHSAKVMAYAIP